MTTPRPVLAAGSAYGGCRFFWPVAWSFDHDGRGTCHRHPPAATRDNRAVWPEVHRSDFCGKWQVMATAVSPLPGA